MGPRGSGQCCALSEANLTSYQYSCAQPKGPLWGGQQPGLRHELAVGSVPSFAPLWVPNLPLPSPAQM